MKTTIQYFSLLLLFIFIATTGAFAAIPDDDPAPDNGLRKFGIGIRAATFTKLELYGTGSPSTLISIVITPVNAFRIEPEFGIFNSKSYSSTLDEDLSDISMHIGMGLYGMINHGSTNIYLGVRLASVSYKSEYANWDSGSFFKDETTGNQLLMGPVVGAEHLFSNHFGFGGEIGILNSNYHADLESGHDHDEDTYRNLLTESALFVRFYF